jgi:hypothetical protein
MTLVKKNLIFSVFSRKVSASGSSLLESQYARAV